MILIKNAFLKANFNFGIKSRIWNEINSPPPKKKKEKENAQGNDLHTEYCCDLSKWNFIALNLLFCHNLELFGCNLMVNHPLISAFSYSFYFVNLIV